MPPREVGRHSAPTPKRLQQALALARCLDVRFVNPSPVAWVHGPLARCGSGPEGRAPRHPRLVNGFAHPRIIKSACPINAPGPWPGACPAGPGDAAGCRSGWSGYDGGCAAWLIFYSYYGVTCGHLCLLHTPQRRRRETLPEQGREHDGWDQQHEPYQCTQRDGILDSRGRGH